MFYWILTTHLVALLPLLMLAYSFKKYRQYESLYTLINIFLQYIVQYAITLTIMVILLTHIINLRLYGELWTIGYHHRV